MILRVGSKNPVKVEAVQECFPDFEIIAVAVDSGIKEQPKSLKETLLGSRNRAQSWEPEWGIGIESGIMPQSPINPKTLVDDDVWINIVACTIWNGKKFSFGLSSGFVVPKKVIDIAFEDNVDLSEAVFRAGLTKEKRVGYKEGIINLLTDGKLDRKQYIKQAIQMAMIQVNHPELF